MARNHHRRHRRKPATKLYQKRNPPVGAPPGTLMVPQQPTGPAIHLIQYAGPDFHEDLFRDADRLRGRVRPDRVSWIDIHGLNDETMLRTVGEIFGLHPLELEDIVNVPQRPKVEAYGDNLLIVARMTRLPEPQQLEMEQVSLVVGPHFVLTFQERYGDILNPLRHRMRQGNSHLRAAGADFLAYSILDAIIDGYYPVLEAYGERLEQLEEQVIAAAHPAVLHAVHEVKRDLLALRRAIWPQREAISTLLRDENRLIGTEARTHLRDCYDHCVQAIDVVETYRELGGALTDLYLSSLANRQNEIMRVLTVIATIFIPLTFVAGIYGMNFEWMPELRQRWGYPAALTVMGAMAAGMLAYFRRKGWFGP